MIDGQFSGKSAMSGREHRYLAITELFLPTKGGTAIWFSEVFKYLGGKKVHIVTADVQGAREVDAVHPNSIHRLNLRRVWWLRPESLGMYARLFIVSLWLAVTRRFDVVHAIRSLPEGLVAWVVARMTFCPVIVYAHGEELTGWGNGTKYKAMCFTLRHADKVVANSDNTRDELLRMGVDADKIAIIYPGVDVHCFRPGLPFDDLRRGLGWQEGQKLVLSVGRLSRRKGFDTVVRCLPQLLQQGLDIQYALIGIGEDHEYLSGLATELGVSERVHFLGHVSPEDLPRWYNACDIFVMPNRDINGDTEGFGMVYLEAAACGKPSIAGKAGGTGNAVIDGATGVRVDGERLGEVATAIERLITDRAYSSRLGRQGYSRAVTEFSWEAIAQKTIALLVHSC
jgi:phosphatidylinositol alpha-1,6-mannosyltransferase